MSNENHPQSADLLTEAEALNGPDPVQDPPTAVPPVEDPSPAEPPISDPPPSEAPVPETPDDEPLTAPTPITEPPKTEAVKAAPAAPAPAKAAPAPEEPEEPQESFGDLLRDFEKSHSHKAAPGTRQLQAATKKATTSSHSSKSLSPATGRLSKLPSPTKPPSWEL